MVTIWRICGRLPNSRQLLLVSCFLFIAWSVTFYHVATLTSSKGQKESEYLKAEIIRLSENYVKALAKENAGVVDGPYAGRFTAYDLKKTMAVLLENMLLRINELEHKINNVMNTSMNGSLHNTSSMHEILQPGNQLLAEDLIKGKTQSCELTAQDHQLYPFCKGKIEWMKEMWKSDPCYASYGVDGSECSFVMYLSEVEGWCPKKAWRGKVEPPKEDPSKVTYANATADLEKLMKILVDPNERQGYAWIRMRIRRMWSRWSSAITRLSQNQDLRGRRKKKILVHLGLLSRQSGWKFAENQFKGGPLGELVQWSDLICTLFILGHEITITSETEQLARHLSPVHNNLDPLNRNYDTCPEKYLQPRKVFDIVFTDIKGYTQMKKIRRKHTIDRILAKLPAANSPCQSRKELPVHIIYTDIVGLRQFKKHVKGGYGKFSCLLRIVDSFGTEPAYNNRVYAKSHKILTSWGGQDLQPQQFFTMFPHSPDNSFMGFVVEQHLNDTISKEIKRKNQAVVYGKNEYMWEGKMDYLNVVKEFVEVHATVYTDKKVKSNVTIPAYVKNHGLLNGEDLHTLLRQSKLFIGLGFPYEGPAPLEAIANGAVFINPKFIPPHNSKNTKFFKGKPTLRELTSQQPYAEQFIGEPHVYTININDLQQVKETIKKILTKDSFIPYLPHEFTEEGMLQRMNAYIEHQNFCQFQKQLAKWPPSTAMSYIFGEQGKSCKEVCWSKNLICEPSHFREVNSVTVLKQKGATCNRERTQTDIYYPALDVDNKDCIIQHEEMLYSCVGAKINLRRLCPCRNYVKGQTALCQGCER